MVEWYDSILVTLSPDVQPIVLCIIIAIVTYIVFRETRHLMNWLRKQKKLPEPIIDTIAPVFRYAIIVIGLVSICLNLSIILGIYDTASAFMPSIIAASIIIIITWFSYQVVKYIFSWLRVQQRIPLDIINVIELISKYGIILLGFVLLILNVVATIIGADIILSLILGWFSTHSGEIVLIVIAIIFVRLIAKFLGRFFENLKRKTSFQQNVLDLTHTGTLALIYLVVGLIVLSSILTIIGAEEMIPLLTSVFSVLFGIGFSFAAAGSIGNIIAGLVLSKWKPYTIGDRVEIGSQVYGDVMEFDILYTKIKTVKEEVTSVPNLSVLMNKVMNYSYLGACIVHSKISIGYDYDRKTVETLLIQAASKTEDILIEPKPFVLISELAKFHIVYEINAYTDQPNRLITIYSNLHKNILDIFEEAQVTIVSPQFFSISIPEKRTS